MIAKPPASREVRSLFDGIRLACRVDSSAAVRDLARRLGPVDLDSPYLALAAWHGVLGLVLARFEREGLLTAMEGGSPGGLSGRLRAMRLHAAVLNLECDRVLEVLTRAGIDSLLLKGAALRRTVYGQAVERPMGDLDILVEPSDLDRAVETLIAAGYARPSERLNEAYRQHHFHVVLRHPAGFLVELHWALCRNDSPFRLDDGEFRRHAMKVIPGEPAVPVPAPEHMVLHMASQNVEDGFSKLRRLVDLDRLARTYPELDWERVVDQARTGGLRHVLAHSLSLTRRLLGTPVPDSILTRLRPPLPTRAHLALLGPERTMVPLGAAGRASADRLLYLWLIEDSRFRAREVVAILRGRGDPMDWVWLHQPEPTERSPRKTGPVLLFKLVAYQLWLYLTAPAYLARHRSHPAEIGKQAV